MSTSLEAAYDDLLVTTGYASAFDDVPPDRMPDLYEWGDFDPGAAAKAIEWLKLARRYTDWSQVGTEPTADFMYRLVTVPDSAGPYLGSRLPALQRTLDAHDCQVRGWVVAAGRELPCQVLAKLFPTGDMNAQAVPVPGCGALLLVNTGLMDLLYGVLKVNVAHSAFRGNSPERPLLSTGQAVMALTEVFNAYLYGKSGLAVQPLPLLRGQRSSTVAYLLDRCEQFVLAHEYGHVLAGHLDDAGCRRLRTEAGEIQVAGAGWDQEHEADEIAVDLMLAGLEARGAWHQEEAYLFAAPELFFAVDRWVTELGQQLRQRPAATTTHPPAQDRADRVGEQLDAARRTPTGLHLADAFSRWFDMMEDGVLDWFQRIDEVMVRPAPGDHRHLV